MHIESHLRERERDIIRSLVMSWFVILFILSFTLNNFSEARNLKKLTSAVVVGSIQCDTGINQDQEGFSNASHLISGAFVAVECGNELESKPIFRQEAKTKENGEFEIHPPFFVVKKIKGCSVKLLKSNNPLCTVASSAASSTLRLKSQKHGTHIFSAGQFTFIPSNEPGLCNQKPEKEKKILSPQDLNFPPPINDPEVPFIPPIPDLPQIPPLPNLPPLPQLPKIPILSSKTTDSSSKVEIVKKDTLDRTGNSQIPLIPSPPSFFGIPFPPNPFQSPPSIFPPIPNPFQPPSPPPVFPIPLPPFSGFPGFPPSSKKDSP